MMPKFIAQKWDGWHLYAVIALTLTVVVGLAFVYWVYSVLAFIAYVTLAYFFWRAYQFNENSWKEYSEALSYRIKHTATDLLQHHPVGIVLYNEDNIVEWVNPAAAKAIAISEIAGRPMDELFPGFALNFLIEGDDGERYVVQDSHYDIYRYPKERLLYLIDVTTRVELELAYEAEKVVIGIMMLDNLDEVTQGMDEQARTLMLASVTAELTNWTRAHHIYLRRLGTDRFIMLTNHEQLLALEQHHFDILDLIRELTKSYKVPITLSIGMGTGGVDLVDTGQKAQASLDIALGRGGDQVAVRAGDRLTFHGGKSNAVEKRTRVRARVISHALRDLIKGSDQVFIMGHRMPDMDAMGAAIGILRAVKLSGKPGGIVLQAGDDNAAIGPMLTWLKERGEEVPIFTPEQALQRTDSRTLLIVVDTHKPELVIESRLLQNTKRVVIIDHHRRGEELINDPILVYMEPYASSTCELVTELLQYYDEQLELNLVEATCLLAGIVVDTKSFVYRTGARTFEAASFLRRHGADNLKVQEMLKEDLETYIVKAEVIRETQMLFRHVALAVSTEQILDQSTIAQVADTLLTLHEVRASFVVSKRRDGTIGISARSDGRINVQLVMERMGGGGHLTHAATQVSGTIEEAVMELKQVIQELREEEEWTR